MREGRPVGDIGIQTLFIRLQRLERCCDVRLESLTDTAGKVSWRVTIRQRSGGSVPLVLEGASAVEALNAGVDRAESTGWHSPPG